MHTVVSLPNLKQRQVDHTCDLMIEQTYLATGDSFYKSQLARDVPPFRPPFFTSGTPSGWVFKCQTYSCWVSIFRFEPLSFGNICEIFIFNHSFGAIFVKI